VEEGKKENTLPAGDPEPVADKGILKIEVQATDSNPSATIKPLDGDEKSQVVDPTSRNNGTGTGINDLLNVISEHGLYRLILTSRKPKAKAFKRWVTHEVLPHIRKTGSYEITKKKPKAEKVVREPGEKAMAMAAIAFDYDGRAV